MHIPPDRFPQKNTLHVIAGALAGTTEADCERVQVVVAAMPAMLLMTRWISHKVQGRRLYCGSIKLLNCKPIATDPSSRRGEETGNAMKQHFFLSMT